MRARMCDTHSEHSGNQSDGVVQLTAWIHRYEPAETKTKLQKKSCRTNVAAEVVAIPVDGTDWRSAAFPLRARTGSATGWFWIPDWIPVEILQPRSSDI